MQKGEEHEAKVYEKHYNDYKKQVFEFSDEWRNYIIPMLFKYQEFKIENYNKMPQFTYQNRIENNVWSSIIQIILISIVLFFLFLGVKIKDTSFKNLF